MFQKISGNVLTPEKIKILLKLNNIMIKFSPFEDHTEFGRKIEGELKKRFGTHGLEYDSESNKFRVEEGKIRCITHDCGSTCCSGLGDIFYVSGEELQEIAKN
ncbi:MAG: hypothetical protein ABIE55_03755 [Candidatus Aenigmatarchaeota archaeon]